MAKLSYNGKPIEDNTKEELIDCTYELYNKLIKKNDGFMGETSSRKTKEDIYNEIAGKMIELMTIDLVEWLEGKINSK